MPAACRVKMLILAMLCAIAPGVSARAQDDARDTGSDPARITQPLDEPVQAAVAAVLLATLGAEFGDTVLEVTLGDAQVEVAGPREHVVEGVGRLRFTGSGGTDDWLAFRYRTRYDPLFSAAGYPQIQLGAAGDGVGERFVPNDAALLRELEDAVASELEALPGAGRVFLQLDEISSLQTGSRFIQIDARGIADFGAGGSTGAHIQALYDQARGAWLSIEHALEPNIGVREADVTAGQ
jgi:hypothetical protein